jgi:hypothetical protein
MPIYGKKDVLVRRLENKDKRWQAYHESLAKSGLRCSTKTDQVPDRYNSNLESFIGNIDTTRQCSFLLIPLLWLAL